MSKLAPAPTRQPIRTGFDLAANDSVIPELFIANTGAFFKRLAEGYNDWHRTGEMQVEQEEGQLTLSVQTLPREGMPQTLWSIYIDYDPLENVFLFPDPTGQKKEVAFKLNHGGIENLRTCYIATIMRHLEGEDIDIADYLVSRESRSDLRVCSRLKEFQYI